MFIQLLDNFTYLLLAELHITLHSIVMLLSPITDSDLVIRIPYNVGYTDSSKSTII